MPVTVDPKALFSRTAILRVISVILAIAGAWGGVSTVPKMASASGAPINDVLNTVLPMLGAAFAWIWSNWSKVKPSLVQAALAAFANPRDPVADLKLAVELSAYLKSQWPSNPAFATLDRFIQEFIPLVTNDLTKTLPVPQSETGS
jgi:hypothetical protein